MISADTMEGVQAADPRDGTAPGNGSRRRARGKQRSRKPPRREVVKGEQTDVCEVLMGQLVKRVCEISPGLGATIEEAAPGHKRMRAADGREITVWLPTADEDSLDPVLAEFAYRIVEVGGAVEGRLSFGHWVMMATYLEDNLMTDLLRRSATVLTGTVPPWRENGEAGDDEADFCVSDLPEDEDFAPPSEPPPAEAAEDGEGTEGARPAGRAAGAAPKRPVRPRGPRIEWLP
jgi:hypothetical protein